MADESRNRPVPQPRRTILPTTTSPRTTYENVNLDLINKNINISDDNLQINRKDKVQNNKTFLLPSGGGVVGSGGNSNTNGNATTSTTSPRITIPPSDVVQNSHDYHRNIITEINNLNIDKNKNFQDSQKLNNLPVPAPRRTAPIETSTTTTSSTNIQQQQQLHQQQLQIDEIYESNEEVTDRSGALYPELSRLSNQLTPIETGATAKKSPLPSTTGVTRKAPTIPLPPPPTNTPSPPTSYEQKRINNLTSSGVFVDDIPDSPLSSKSSARLRKSDSSTSINSSTSGGGGPNDYNGGGASGGSSSSSSSSPKYITTSPGSLLKSLGATSKLLSESITERVSVRTKDAKHKIDKIQKSSIDKLTVTKKMATKQINNVRNFSLGRSKHNESSASTTDFGDLDRPKTVPANDEIFKSITFNSPLKSKVDNCYDLTESSYEVPRKSTSASSYSLQKNNSNDLSSSASSIYPSKYKVRGDDDSVVDDFQLNKTNQNPFERNTQITQSMFNSGGGGIGGINSKKNHPDILIPPIPATRRIKIQSESDLTEISEKSKKSPLRLTASGGDTGGGCGGGHLNNNDDDSPFEKPCPSYPPPPLVIPTTTVTNEINHRTDPLQKEGIYGKIKKSNIPSSDEQVKHLVIPVRPPVRTKRRKEYEETKIRQKPTNSNISSDTFLHDDPTISHSNRATVDSAEFPNDPIPLVPGHSVTDDRIPRIFSRDVTTNNNSSDSSSIVNLKKSIENTKLIKETYKPSTLRSDSWSFYDSTSNTNDGDSTPEPIYANEINDDSIGDLASVSNVSESVYGRLYDPTNAENHEPMLTPQTVVMQRPKISQMVNRSVAPTASEIIREFDPLVMTTVDQICSNKSNELILLESLLGEETYGFSSGSSPRRATLEPSTQHTIDDTSDDDDGDDDNSVTHNDGQSIGSNEDAISLPDPPRRQDSITMTRQKPTISDANSRISNSENRKTVIIHQNTILRSDSIENILDAEDQAVGPYLSQCSEPVATSSNQNDLSRPKPSRSNWFVDEVIDHTPVATNKKVTNTVSIPISDNTSSTTTTTTATTTTSKSKSSTDKLPPPEYAPPTYNEAIGEAIAEPFPIPGDDKRSPKVTIMKSMFSNVLNKMEGINLGIKRKTSFKGTTAVGGGNNNSQTSQSGSNRLNDVKTIIEMIPKALLTQRLVLHEGSLIRLPSKAVDDILKEQHMRKAFIREGKFQAYFDKELRMTKEQFPLEHIASIQCVSKHKYTNNSIELHCFEITTISEKNSHRNHGGSSSGGGGSNNLMHNGSEIATTLSNPNMKISSSNSGNVKMERNCHLYGIAKESDRFIWMQKLLESLTDVFQTGYTCKFYRAGWCYLKNSITSQWSGAWILLQKQKKRLVCYNNAEMNIEILDLRKARCLVLNEPDDSINNLHVESGPMLMIDCPPYSMYMIMASPRETKTWRHIIMEVAHNTGPSLKEQQLTKDDIPVLVDKCINFVYAHGSMSEGIYRKSGSENSINKLLTLFRTDAFGVQITRTEYNEHDVANALKRFMRDLPERLLAKYAASFVSVSEMKSKTDKVAAYKELLKRLPSIEFHTLRKLIGHLNFIQSQKIRNKMGVDNLAIVWGPTLLEDKHMSEMEFSQREANVIVDLVMLHKYLYQLTSDEMAKEQIMLSVLQKYHAAAENLSDSVKQSGDLKVWITIDPNPDDDQEEKQQINVTLTPTKTVYDVCKELAPKMKKQAFAVTLSENILNGDLHRPLHYSEKVFDVVLKWSYWPELDRKNNFLQLQPMKFLKDVERALKNLPIVSPNKELKFVDCKTKSFKSYTLELADGHITVVKREKNAIVKIRDIDLKKSIAYLGCEKKRDFQLRWAITIIDADNSQKCNLRTRESPYFGHVIAGTNSNDSIVWYSSILHSLYGENILPNPEIIIP